MEFKTNYKVARCSPSEPWSSSLPKYLVDIDGVDELTSPPAFNCFALFLEWLENDFQWFGLFAPDLMDIPERNSYFACPNPTQIGVITGFEVYHGTVNDPGSFRLIDPWPVDALYSFPESSTVLLSGEQDLVCIDESGPLWKVERLTPSDVIVTRCHGGKIFGCESKSAKCDTSIWKFEIDLKSGEVLSDYNKYSKTIPLS